MNRFKVGYRYRSTLVSGGEILITGISSDIIHFKSIKADIFDGWFHINSELYKDLVISPYHFDEDLKRVLNE